MYDSSDLEQWLDNAEYVLRWFADYLRKAPYDGIDLAEEFWKYWSIYENIALTPGVILAGREKEQEEILKFQDIAYKSKKGYLNIADHDMYWF